MEEQIDNIRRKVEILEKESRGNSINQKHRNEEYL